MGWEHGRTQEEGQRSGRIEEHQEVVGKGVEVVQAQAHEQEEHLGKSHPGSVDCICEPNRDH